MATSSSTSVLARIVAAHAGAGAGQLGLVSGLETGLTRAIRRASLPFAALAARVSDVTVATQASLTDAVEALPEHGLLAAVEDEDGRRGLVALAHPVVDALIEVQTTGHVEEVDLPPRTVTRIDEALCRDFLDLVFGSFAQETAPVAGRDWPDRIHYGSMVPDPAQLNLLLPERGYHLLQATITAADRKTGRFVLLLPTDPALARRHASKASGAAPKAPADWGDRVLAALAPAPMVLDAVLLRVVMPLGQVEALAVDDLVPFEHADLARVQLESEDGHILAKGALGQAGGKRAFRLNDPSQVSQAPRALASEAQAPAEPFAAAAPLAPAEAGAPPPLDQPAMAPAPGGLPDIGTPPPQGAPDLPDLPPIADMAAAGGFDPNAPMGGFDPDAPMGGFDPDAPMGGFDPDAPMGGFDPDAPMGGFDPDAPMG